MLPLFLFLFLFIPTISSSSPLSTVAISRVNNQTLVCALLPSTHRYDLRCTAFPSVWSHQYPSAPAAFSALAAGDGFLCALRGSTQMLWWDFTHTARNNSVPKPKLVYRGPSVRALSAGDSHVCGLFANSTSLQCWRWRRLYVPKELNAADVAVGGSFVCALSTTGAISCFGDDVGVISNVPLGNYTAVAAGSTHACGVSEERVLVCWGDGAPWVDGTNAATAIESLALGRNRTCVLYVNGTVRCYGEDVALPKDVAGSQLVAIEARGDTVCGVLLVNYSLVCWGSEAFRGKHVVFSQVLPGTCAPISSCSCGFVAGSGTMCANGAVCRSCRRENQPAAEYDRRENRNKRRLIFVLIGSIGCGIGVLAAACFIYVRIWNKSGRVHDSVVAPTGRPGQESCVDTPPRQILSNRHGSTIEEFPIKLLLGLTDGFSDKHKIGSGSFGSVYRAKLADGRSVAIKRAEPSSAASTSRARTSDNKESAFVSEVAHLSRVNHKNLVRLLGYCRDGVERVLVYEFVPNGSLHHLLHGSDPQLGSWRERIRVALDAARGIEYLHSYAVPPIIHRDIKSSNILLDEDWTAKVSDFGLSTHTDSSSGSFCTAGTVGYMDPEYYRLQHLNAKSDVYSLGVVLLEIMSGCKVIQRYGESDSPKNVVEVMVPHIEADEMHRVLDRRLTPPTLTEIEGVAFVSHLAADCVSAEGRDRPTMTEVVNGLERALAACTIRPSSRSISVESV